MTARFLWLVFGAALGCNGDSEGPALATGGVAVAIGLEATRLVGLWRPGKACDRGPGSVTDEDVPVLVGGHGDADFEAWFEKKGVPRARSRAWLNGRYWRTTQGGPAGVETECAAVSVGPSKEDALLCRVTFSPTSLLHSHAAIVVARGGAPFAVSSVGIGIGALDWPEAHWLDLSLRVADDGMSMDVRDRAPNGATLVATAAECAAAETDPLARAHLSWYPAKLAGCDAALDALKEAEHEERTTHPFIRTDFTSSRLFAVASCGARGHYVWRGDRFTRDRDAGP